VFYVVCRAEMARLGGAFFPFPAFPAKASLMTLKTRIIPCLDVKDGRTVKGVNFVDLKDAGDPVALAKAYDLQGADELCFLDITASHEGRGTLLDIVSATAEQCFMPLTVGGGVRSADDLVALLRAGADKVAINSAAVADPSVIANCAAKAGRQAVVVAIDARRVGDHWEIFTHGGRQETGIDAVAFAKEAEARGAGEILLTSMDRDGTKSGYDIELLKAVTSAVNIPVVASGGAGSVNDMPAAVLEGGATAVLAASIFHFGEATVADARKALADAGAPVRPF
jgi:cyclase